MIIKFIGFLLTSSSICIFGFYCSYKDIYRSRDLMELKKALIILKKEISYLLSPMNIAVMNVSKRVNSPISNMFINFKVEFNYESDLTIEDMWIKSFSKSVKKTYFNKEDSDNIKNLGKALGYLDVNLQTGNIDILIDYIDLSVAEIGRAKDKRKGLYQSLSILGSILVIILLI